MLKYFSRRARELFLKSLQSGDVVVLGKIRSHSMGGRGHLYLLVRRNGEFLVVPELDEEDSPENSSSEDEKVSWKESEARDVDGFPALRPPEVKIACGNFEGEENSTSILCKNIYVEFLLIGSILKAIKPLPTITCLKIEDCCIGKDFAEELADILAQETGRQITELSLNGNLDLGPIIPCFITRPTGLKSLCLQRCGLEDDDLNLLAPALSAFNNSNPQTLLFLNLGMNKIGDAGASRLAEALRTNRSLTSLSLMGNHVEDRGAFRLAEILTRFQLTDEEIQFKRRRIFDGILKKLNLKEKTTSESKEQGDGDKETSKTSGKYSERILRKVRGPDGKICLSSRDKRSKTGLSKSEKFNGKARTGVEGHEKLSEKKLSDASTPNIELETHADDHPLVSEIFPEDGKLWCQGCWSLTYLNLSFNNLTEKSVEKFTETILFQSETFKAPKEGLLDLRLCPGNFIDEQSKAVDKLRNAMLAKLSSEKTLQLSPSRM